ncbi:40S ribosomal protein SA [Culex quinquefasciatus]|uniref:40S ribosomal protein SA n=1 Tax=Culex quinquefasciatus TaxID=7176 RepID=B0WNU7_CULQU|nr:40S ribosomal protein SA [Culex quinquefasciatus]|eukprot:XP_001850381.1 40S ribosomal protein SA [Culex quinquefasciatus]
MAFDETHSNSIQKLPVPPNALEQYQQQSQLVIPHKDHTAIYSLRTGTVAGKSSTIRDTLIAGRFTFGANQIQPTFCEPRLLIETDPLTDHQSMMEASYDNFVKVAFPCSTKSSHTIGLMYWLLDREVLKLRGKISDKWELKPDLFFYRDPKEQEKG